MQQLINYCRNLLKNSSGQIIAFTALILPLFIAAAGLSIDFGNLYMHKSRLQNIADAAAIAGGNVYVTSKEELRNHPEANSAANTSVKLNMPIDNIQKPDDNLGIYKVGKKSDDTYYYYVHLTEEVPVYFLSFFPGIASTQNVTADAYARIVFTGGGGGSGGGGTTSPVFDNVFTVQGKFIPQEDSRIDNPEKPSSNFHINQVSVFNGKINTGEKSNFVLPTSETIRKDENGNYIYKDQGPLPSEAYMSVDTASSTTQLQKDMLTAKDEIIKAAESVKNVHKTDQNVNSNNLNDLVKKGYNAIFADSDQATNLSIDSDFTGDDTPFYFIIKSNASGINFNINAKNITKPFIYVYTGTADIWLNLNGANFNGMIYAPNANVHVNDDGLKFTGSIIAKELELKGHRATYNFKNYLGGGGGGDSPSGGSVGLASGEEDLEWE